MGLRARFNIVLAAVFALGLLASALVSDHLLKKNARDEVVANAGVMMAAAIAIRGYTVEHVKDKLELQLMRGFLPESVPAFAAAETFGKLREKYPDYTYKEAALNPTNPKNRPTDWEADIIEEFRNSASKQEIIVERDTSSGRALSLARPIQVKNDACLVCHSVPAAAPRTMVERYGENNGFGWKLNETIGAQIVSVPMSVPLEKAYRTFLAFMLSLTVVLLVVFLTLNIMLGAIVLRPITKMSKIADQVSMGNMDIPEFVPKGQDEISVLANSFNRMRRSLEKAMSMLES